jgi:hypothetical protein
MFKESSYLSFCLFLFVDLFHLPNLAFLLDLFEFLFEFWGRPVDFVLILMHFPFFHAIPRP